jgi:hypothetical protein
MLHVRALVSFEVWLDASIATSIQRETTCRACHVKHVCSAPAGARSPPVRPLCLFMQLAPPVRGLLHHQLLAPVRALRPSGDCTPRTRDPTPVPPAGRADIPELAHRIAFLDWAWVAYAADVYGWVCTYPFTLWQWSGQRSARLSEPRCHYGLRQQHE